VSRTLYRDAALADGRSASLQVGLSVLVDSGRISWIRPSDAELDPALLATAEHNGRLMSGAGIRWARDVGSPTRVDPHDGRERALAMGVRDRWRGRSGYPHVRAGGTWLMREGTLRPGLAVDVTSPDQLLAAALRQLDDGADFVKLYLDGPDPNESPWTAAQIRPVVEAVHARGARVTAHAGRLNGAQACAGAAVDCIEHGFELDGDTARLMASNRVALVSTLTAIRSWQTFARTTRIPRFASEEGRSKVLERWEMAKSSVAEAHRAGVLIAAGTDFGGGSARANQLAWEVESLVEAGLEPWEGLAAATWRGGLVLGEPEAGVIREGGPSDFFLVHGDPLSDPAALWRVWRTGYQSVQVS
jgi:hypothetical protein